MPRATSPGPSKVGLGTISGRVGEVNTSTIRCRTSLEPAPVSIWSGCKFFAARNGGVDCVELLVMIPPRRGQRVAHGGQRLFRRSRGILVGVQPHRIGGQTLHANRGALRITRLRHHAHCRRAQTQSSRKAPSGEHPRLLVRSHHTTGRPHQGGGDHVNLLPGFGLPHPRGIPRPYLRFICVAAPYAPGRAGDGC